MLIESVALHEGPEGQTPSLEITDSTSSDNPHHIFISLGAFGSWGELLGFRNHLDTLEAILEIDKQGGEPESDPAVLASLWSDSYALLAHRETSRVMRAMEIEAEPESNPQSPVTGSTLAAYNAVHIPDSSGICGFNRCRLDTRQKLGVTEDTARCGATSRVLIPEQEVNTNGQLIQFVNGEGTVEEAPLQVVFAPIIQNFLPTIEDLRRKFLSYNAKTPSDPLEKYLEPLVEPEPEMTTIDAHADALDRYLGETT